MSNFLQQANYIYVIVIQRQSPHSSSIKIILKKDSKHIHTESNIILRHPNNIIIMHIYIYIMILFYFIFLK